MDIVDQLHDDLEALTHESRRLVTAVHDLHDAEHDRPWIFCPDPVCEAAREVKLA